MGKFEKLVEACRQLISQVFIVEKYCKRKRVRKPERGKRVCSRSLKIFPCRHAMPFGYVTATVGGCDILQSVYPQIDKQIDEDVPII